MSCKRNWRSPGARTLGTTAWILTTGLWWIGHVQAQVNVTETFNVGAGSRFNLSAGNDISRPKPATWGPSPDPNPADDAEIDDAFGGTRTMVQNGNIVTNHFGFTRTNNAGGAGAGEIGGEFNWFDFGGIADSNLGGSLNLSQEVVIRAKVNLVAIGPENDQRVQIGYYDLPASPDASSFNRGNVRAGIGFTGGNRFLLVINGANADPINLISEPGTPFDVDLTLKFSESEGRAWFEGTVDAIPISRINFDRSASASHLMNGFAISQSFLREAQDAWRRSGAFIDDVTYTVASDQGIDNPNPVRIDAPGGPGLVADFNGDGNVDGGDLSLWTAGFGQASGAGLVNGDANADGDVDGKDFLDWQSNFGATSGSIVAIPEPGSATVVLCAVMACASRARRRKLV